MLALRDQSLAEARREAREGGHRREAACAHCTVRDGRRAGVSVWRAMEPSTLTQHFVAVWGAFQVFAFISALPRGIALLALSSQATTGIREVLEEEVGFGDMMAGCKATDQVWTGLFHGGRLHTWMIIADYACYYCGSFMAFSASVYATFSVISCRATTAASGFVVILAACNIAAGMASAVNALGQQDLTTVVSGPRQSQKMFNSLLFAIIFVGFILFTILNMTLDPNRAPSTCGENMRWGVRKFRTVISIGLILLFCFMVGDIQTRTLVLATGGNDSEYEFLGVLVPLVLGKLVLTVLRIQTRGGDSLPLTTALMLSFLGNSFATLAARRFIFQGLEGTALVLNCALIALLEILTRWSVFWFGVIAAGSAMRSARINTQTLDGLLHLHDRLRLAIDEHCSHMLIDQVSEIAVCVTVAMQYLCVPQWVVRKTLQEYQDRASQIFLSLAVQLIFEVLVDFCIVRITFRGWEGLVPFWELCKRVLWNRYLVLFCFGIMVYHGRTFWPKCTTCQKPIECLLYLECARGLPVKLGTQPNVCLKVCVCVCVWCVCDCVCVVCVWCMFVYICIVCVCVSTVSWLPQRRASRAPGNTQPPTKQARAHTESDPRGPRL
jgi:hypothetical protein